MKEERSMTDSGGGSDDRTTSAVNKTTRKNNNPPFRTTMFRSRSAYAQSDKDHHFPDDYFSAFNEAKVEDVTIEIFYKPHTVTALILTIGYITYAGFTSDDSDSILNAWQGIKTIILFFLLISALAFPNGPFVRPHPIVWRMAFGLSILYLMLLQFTIFQNFRDIKKVLKWIDPDRLSQETLEEKEYAVNCSQLNFDRFMDHMDVFAFGHFFGWGMKALLIRHGVLCWYISITWEITEMVFAHLLPNFMECWWDQWILDVLLCNGLGIWLGITVCRFMNARPYHWESVRDIRGYRGKIKRIVLQFTPMNWQGVEWMDSKSTFYRCFAVANFVLIWHVIELNTFFLKHIFAVDTAHPLVVCRILLIGVIGAPTIRQYYGYVTDPRVTKRLGNQCWVHLAVTLSESVICLKFGHELFAQTNMIYIILWVVFLVTQEVKVNGSERIEHEYHDASRENLVEAVEEAVERESIRRRKKLMGYRTTGVGEPGASSDVDFGSVQTGRHTLSESNV